MSPESGVRYQHLVRMPRVNDHCGSHSSACVLAVPLVGQPTNVVTHRLTNWSYSVIAIVRYVGASLALGRWG